MSSRVKLLVAVAGLAAFGTMAHAADLAVPPAVAPVPYSWTGSGTQWGTGWAAAAVAVFGQSAAPTPGGAYVLESTEYF